MVQVVRAVAPQKTASCTARWALGLAPLQMSSTGGASPAPFGTLESRSLMCSARNARSPGSTHAAACNDGRRSQRWNIKLKWNTAKTGEKTKEQLSERCCEPGRGCTIGV